MSKKKNESSSSEDEICIEALKEAADQDFLKNSFFDKEKEPLKNANEKIVEEKNESESLPEYETHGLSQSCRDFIAKKLNERLDIDIIVEDKNKIKKKLRKNKKVKDSSDDLLGIKLFNTSNEIITNFEEDIEPQCIATKRKSNDLFDEKMNYLNCKEVAVDPQTILSQSETKYWTNRKVNKVLRYKKLKDGTLMEINQS